MRRWIGVLVTLTIAACAPGLNRVKPALQASDSDTVWLATDDGHVLSGELTVPPGPGPFPAVILMHGCRGLPSRAIGGWEPMLRSWGYATFVLNSFSGRGLQEACTDALAFTPNRRIADAYAALKIVATHAKIDRDRIVLMGFSHGGTATLAAATEWASRTYVRQDGVGFRGFIPFYPYCNAVVPEMAGRVTAPVRIHIGELDDMTPARTCGLLSRAARSSGADIEIIVYKNAPHSFDSVGESIHRLPDIDNAANCTPRLAGMKGPILNLAELKQCMRKGATVGWNPEATEEARRNVWAQLAEFLN